VSQSLPAVLEQFLQNVDGLQAVVVTDRDGVVVAKGMLPPSRVLLVF